MFFQTMIRYWKKSDQWFNIFICNLFLGLYMTETVWKCFRCNLSFKDYNLAEMHKEISDHSITKVKTLAA